MVLDVAILNLTSESAILSLLASFNISDSEEESTAIFWIVAALLFVYLPYIGGWVYSKKRTEVPWTFQKS